MAELYPPVAKEALSHLIGQSIRDVPAPAAVVDLAAVSDNCQRMLDACNRLGLQWRAHVKTHKTVEITRLQLGEGAGPARIVVSTLAELRFLVPLFMKYKNDGRAINILYGLPLGPAQVPDLAAAAKALGDGSISVLVDHQDQLEGLERFKELSRGVIPLVQIKIDMGGRRSGVIIGTEQFQTVISAVIATHVAGVARLSGLYSHAGHSYGGDSQVAAISMLHDEMAALLTSADLIQQQSSSIPHLTLSAGATPTALSIQSVTDAAASSKPELQTAITSLHLKFDEIRASKHTIEIHAGVFPLLDLQQLAAHSLSTSQTSWSNLAFTLIAEVASVYPGRGENKTPEYLIGAGGLALGRETCKAYAGMAKLTPWNRAGAQMPAVEVEDERGWQVGRFSQEHGILTWTGEPGAEDALHVGQKVRLWPNHACITSSHFGWYYVVDSREGDGEKVVDCWVKARGW